MMSLTSLNLNNNYLSASTEDCLKNSMELSEFHLKENNLNEETLEWWNLNQFKKLENLDLSDNKFDKIPYRALNGLNSIVSLKISIDEFSKPVEKKTWPTLKNLDLSGSKIKKIENSSFDMFPNLTDLTLKDSHLQIVEADAFDKLDSLIFVICKTF